MILLLPPCARSDHFHFSPPIFLRISSPPLGKAAFSSSINHQPVLWCLISRSEPLNRGGLESPPNPQTRKSALPRSARPGRRRVRAANAARDRAHSERNSRSPRSG